MANGEYRKVRLLGSGGLGSVYEGSDDELERAIAIRELARHSAEDDRLRTAYFEWVRRLAEIAHPNILMVHAVEEDAAPPRVVFELAQDGTVRKKIEGGAVEPEEAADLMRQTLRGLREIHRHRLVHGDLKPESLFLQRGVLKIGDPGLAGFRSPGTRPLGSERYAAPELLTDERGSDEAPEASIEPAADLYALGISVYELVLGSARFRRVVAEFLQNLPDSLTGAGGEPDEIHRLWTHLHTSSRALPTLSSIDGSIPKGLSAIIEKLTAKSLEERYLSAEDALADLGEMHGWTAMLEAMDGSHKGSGPVNEQRLFLSRRRVVAGLVSAFALLTVVAIGCPEPPSGADQGRAVNKAGPGADGSSGPSSGPDGESAGLTTADRLHSELAPHLADRADLELVLQGSLAPMESLTFGSLMRFEARSEAAGHVLFFALSSEGAVSCLYPNSRRAGLRIKAGRPLVLPLPEDTREGYEIHTAPPAGSEAAYLLVSAGPLPPLPSSGVTGEWVTIFPSQSGESSPAREFINLVLGLLEGSAEDAQLARVEYQVAFAP